MEPPPCCKARLLPFQALKGSCAPQDPSQEGPHTLPGTAPGSPPALSPRGAPGGLVGPR